ncbi:flavodoxin family protein [Geosporobacter ferrireducens]|uniref:NADPH-dependent FMN reductase-like domain-containing protein n=1 Tax=Geosporobacter ferrireducens TaxID=1424294 RepID=A0A1D8GFD5_9FIRM|nr:flavodoxin family protein [Geosporobacter ferrireducens]AOT69616.1 hypothetical protein Gferi_08520 [Geosporobacter ferrireducens]MTI54682.1 flavodoxin family protein [Geosporobacter ferrireducens]
MKALILNGALKEDQELVAVSRFAEEILVQQGYEVDSILLREKEIGECIGCFDCWVKTPGICIINDYGRIIAEKIINSEFVLWLTPIAYGGYSSELKKAMDRIIPLLLPFFKKVQGEVHHKERYEKYPRVSVLGVMEEKDDEREEIFNCLIKRNALNWYNTYGGGILYKGVEGDMKNQLEEQLMLKEGSIC